MNSLAKGTQAFRRIAKAAILRDLCPKGMGVSMKKSIVRVFLSFILVSVCSCLFSGKAFAETVEKDLFYNDIVKDVMISVSWEKNDASFTIIDPSGTVINPGTNSKTVTSIGSDGGSVIIIKNAAVGQWKWRYDKGSNEYLEVSVSDYKEPVWIKNFKIGALNGKSLPFRFETVSNNSINYNYTINIKTSEEASTSKEIYNGSAQSGAPVEGNIDLSGINTYDSYVLELKASYMDAGLEYFDVAYSEAFSYKNPDQITGITDFGIMLDETAGRVSVNNIVGSDDSADEIIVRIYADTTAILETTCTPEEISECSASYSEDAKELKIGLTLVSDGNMSEECSKTCTIAPNAGELNLTLPDYSVTNQKVYPVKYTNAKQQNVNIILNDTKDTWVLDGNGEKLIDLTKSNSTITIEYTDSANITRRYEKTVALDLYPPILSIFDSFDGMVTADKSIIIAGETQSGAIVTVNGTAVQVKDTGTFLYTCPLNTGNNNISVIAKDLAGNETSYYACVTRGTTSKLNHFITEYFPLLISLAASFIGIILIILLTARKKGKVKLQKNSEDGNGGNKK